MRDRTWEDFQDTVQLLDLEEARWRDGPPPSIGWWPASVFEFSACLRWWNGTCWSFPVDRTSPLHEVILMAKIPSACQDRIQWQVRPIGWPSKSHT